MAGGKIYFIDPNLSSALEIYDFNSAIETRGDEVGRGVMARHDN